MQIHVLVLALAVVMMAGVGDELHFQSYTYSDHPRLYSHPVHKSLTPIILQPTNDGKLRCVVIIEKRRFEFLLNRT